MILRCILEIKLLSVQLLTTGFISVNWIRSFLGKWLKREKRKTIEVLNHLKMVGENRKGFIERQYKMALVARKIYHMLGAPTLRSLKMIIRQNIIKNCSVTVEDIEIPYKIIGPDVSNLKGRKTIQRPKVVVDYFIGISR